MTRRSDRLRIATWNINSLRLRAPLLRRLVAALDPDVLCLQETKVPDDLFPDDVPEELGYRHVARRGMKGYNGVAILSRIRMEVDDTAPDWCERGDCRHLGVRLPTRSGPIELHDFYVPAGGDVPDPAANPKFAHKLAFVAEATQWFAARGAVARSVLVGDLNIAPLEHDVWSHRQLLTVVSHTPGRGRSADGVAAHRLRRCGAPFRAGRPRSCTRGGRTATGTGAPPIAAGGWIMSG